jgi:uncharacterized protein YecE (DUF72 family)
MKQPLIGCSGWAGSQGDYFSEFPVIEIQSTFYDPPAAKVAVRWRAVAPTGFEFCIKAWQLITHAPSSPTYRRLRQPIDENRRALYGSFQDTDEVWEAWQQTLEIAEAVCAKVVLFQCPASFQATRQNIHNLSRFFRKIGPQAFGLAWEPRGPWPPETIHEICANHDLIYTVDPLQNKPERQPRLYWRLHGKGSYSYRYSDTELIHLRHLLCDNGPYESACIFFNNVTMKEDAQRFRLLLDD